MEHGTRPKERKLSLDIGRRNVLVWCPLHGHPYRPNEQPSFTFMRIIYWRFSFGKGTTVIHRVRKQIRWRVSLRGSKAMLNIPWLAPCWLLKRPRTRWKVPSQQFPWGQFHGCRFRAWLISSRKTRSPWQVPFTKPVARHSNLGVSDLKKIYHPQSRTRPSIKSRAKTRELLLCTIEIPWEKVRNRGAWKESALQVHNTSVRKTKSISPGPHFPVASRWS